MTHRLSSSAPKKIEMWQIVRLSKDSLEPLWNLSQQKAPTRRRHSLGGGEDSKESLLAGEVSRFRKASQSSREVPKGYLAVYVGSELQRYIIPTTYLSMPEFKILMERAADEFGFEQEGGLKIPCEEEDFQEVLLKCLETQQKMKKGRK